jgi:hypothetical protein
MFDETEKKLKQLERMVECAYLNGFHYNESHTPRFAAQVLINDLRNAIINEMVSARLMALSD